MHSPASKGEPSAAAIHDLEILVCKARVQELIIKLSRVKLLDIRASRHPASAVFASAWAAAGALFSTAESEQAHLYGITLLAPGGRRGCTSGCWYPDGTLPVDL